MHSMSLVSKFGTSHSSPAQITANGLSFDVNIQDGVELVFLFIHIYTNILIFVITAMFRQLYSLTFFRCLPINGGGVDCPCLSISCFSFFLLFTPAQLFLIVSPLNMCLYYQPQELISQLSFQQIYELLYQGSPNYGPQCLFIRPATSLCLKWAKI